MAYVRERGMECEAIIDKLSSIQLSSSQDATYRGTHSAINGNDETHDSVAKDTGPNCHSPAEANGYDTRTYATRASEYIQLSALTSPMENPPIPTHETHRERLTNFPIRDSPGVSHPVGDIRAPVPCAF